MKHTVLYKVYKDERYVDVKERIILVRRVLSDKQHIESVAQELHKSRAWAYKWYKRYTDEGLKDKPRSGRPPLVNNDLMIKIRKELENINIGWDFRQVMDLIHKRGV
ncbi:MAG: leucine zipper domain-containing protein [Candidatus Nitrosocosmicus sp.]